MHRLAALYSGELTRMRKYGITGAGIVTAVLWVLILHFGSFASIDALFPLVLFMDATVMSLLLSGVTMIFERQENAIKSIFVLPINKDDYLVSKSLAVATSSLFTLLLLFIYGTVVKGLEVNILGLSASVLLISFSFSQLGAVMTYFSKDFTDLLMGMFKFTIVFALPTILELIGMLKADWIRYVQYFNPTKNAMVLLQASATPVETVDLVIATLYMLVAGAALYAVSRKLLDQYVAKGGGV